MRTGLASYDIIQLLCVRFLSLHVSKLLLLLKFLVRWHVKGVAPAKTGG